MRQFYFKEVTRKSLRTVSLTFHWLERTLLGMPRDVLLLQWGTLSP